MTDRVALVVDAPRGAQTWTYAELWDRVHREARRLDAHGVGRGDVVVVLTGDSPLTFVMRRAVNAVGAAVTVLADGHAAPAIAEILYATGAGLLVTDRAHAELAAAAAGPVDVLDLDAAPLPVDASPFAVETRPGQLVSISLTGGSTGTPKAVPRYRPATAAPAGPSLWEGAVQLLCTPVAYIGGSLVAEGVLAAGGRVVLQAGFDPARVLAAIPREGITTMFLLPRLLHQLLDHPDLRGTDTSSLRSIYLGSAPASPERIGEAVARFGPIVAQAYGSTEAGNIAWMTAEELARPALRGSVGRATGGARISIRDDDGAELPAGQTGEVCVATPTMSGYLDAPEQTSALFRDGWLRTGDLGSLDDDGYLWLRGRRSEVIFAEHARIHPPEVEDALLRHPSVAAAAVFGVCDDDGVESAVAAVVPRAGRAPSAEELVDWVVRERGRAVAPARVHLVDELPTTPSAKVDRTALRARFAAHQGVRSPTIEG